MKLNNKLQLIKDSLILLIENMNDNDNLALVKFDIDAEIYLDFTSMISENKIQVIEKIITWRYIGYKHYSRNRKRIRAFKKRLFL